MKLNKYLTELNKRQEIENFIRDSLSGTPRKTTADLMYTATKAEFKGLPKGMFMKVWNELVKEKFLIKVSGNSYKWEM